MKRISTTLFLVCLTLLAVNAEPTVKKHAYGTIENVKLVLDAESGVLGEDKKKTAGTLVFDKSSKGDGTVTGSEDGSFTYVPVEGFTGTDSFEYTLEKPDEKVKGIVSVAVYGEDEAHAYATSENVALVLDAESGVLGKGTLNGGASVFGSSSKGGGTVTGLDDGSFTYVPARGYTGTDSFEYKLEKAGKEVSGTVSVAIYSELRGVGWLFMIMSILGVWTLLVVCYKKLLFDDD